MDPVVVAFPDCYTALGGNQYVNSPAVGRYADYLNQELVPLVSKELNVVDHRDGRGVLCNLRLSRDRPRRRHLARRGSPAARPHDQALTG